MDLEGWSSRLKVFADATRVRLLALLEREELTVAELSAITRLAQPRVSTHLSKLKEAGLVRDRRSGVSAYYRFDEAALDAAQLALWQTLREGSDDPLLRQDRDRVTAVPAARGKRWRAPHCRCLNPATCSTSLRATACSRNCSRRIRTVTSAWTRAPRSFLPHPSACVASKMSRCARATCTRCPSPARNST